MPLAAPKLWKALGGHDQVVAGVVSSSATYVGVAAGRSSSTDMRVLGLQNFCALVLSCVVGQLKTVAFSFFFHELNACSAQAAARSTCVVVLKMYMPEEIKVTERRKSMSTRTREQERRDEAKYLCQKRQTNLREILGTPARCPWDTQWEKQVVFRNLMWFSLMYLSALRVWDKEQILLRSNKMQQDAAKPSRRRIWEIAISDGIRDMIKNR